MAKPREKKIRGRQDWVSTRQSGMNVGSRFINLSILCSYLLYRRRLSFYLVNDQGEVLWNISLRWVACVCAVGYFFNDAKSVTFFSVEFV